MIKMKSKVCAVLILLLVLAAFPVQAFAAGKIIPQKDVTLTISYKDKDTAAPISKAKFNLYKVADVDEYARMTLTEEFKPYENTVLGLSDLEGMDYDKWMELAKALKPFVQVNNFTAAAGGSTNDSGILSVNVKPGLYLVVGYRVTKDDYYTYTPTPYMIFLPGEDVKKNDWSYSVTTLPKSEKDYYPPDIPDPVVTRKVLKVWEDTDYELIRPKEVKVHLLCDGEIYDTVTLNQANEWRWAWDNLDAKYEWEVVEDELQQYAFKIVQNGITFVITNKYIVPVTPVDPPVIKRLTGDKPKTPATFTFVMTAKDASFPMPPESSGSVKELSITGAGSAEFGKITFKTPGTYEYTIYEKNSGVKGYTYDDTVYTLTYKVTQTEDKLNVQTTITDSDGNSADEVVFTNKYKEKIIPKTGVTWWPVPVLLLVGSALVMIGVIRRRRYD